MFFLFPPPSTIVRRIRRNRQSSCEETSVLFYFSSEKQLPVTSSRRELLLRHSSSLYLHRTMSSHPISVHPGQLFNPMDNSMRRKYLNLLSVLILVCFSISGTESKAEATGQFVRFGKSGQFVRFGRNGLLDEYDSPRWPSFLQQPFNQVPSSDIITSHPDGEQPPVAEKEDQNKESSDQFPAGELLDKNVMSRSLGGDKKRKLFFFLRNLFPATQGSKRHEYRPPFGAFAGQSTGGGPVGISLEGGEGPNVSSFIRFG